MEENNIKQILKENAIVELHARIDDDYPYYTSSIINRLIDICKEMGTKDGYTLKFTALNYDREQKIISITRSTTTSHVG